MLSLRNVLLGSLMAAAVTAALPSAAWAASGDIGVDAGVAPPGVADNVDVMFPIVPEVLLAPNPYGCVGRTDNPHISTAEVSVHARTTCQVNVGYVSVETDLLSSPASPGQRTH